MLETKDLGYEGSLELKKVSKGKIIGVVATVASALAIATGVHFLNGRTVEAVPELAMPLVDLDFDLEQPFRALNFQPALYVGGVNIGNLNRSERMERILNELEAQRGTVFSATFGDSVLETTLGELGLGLTEDIQVILDRLEEAKAGLLALSKSERRLPVVHNLEFATTEAGISRWAEQLAWQFNAPAVEPGLRMVQPGDFQVTSGQQGMRIDTGQFVRDVTEALNGSGNTVELVGYSVNPRFDEASLAHVDTVVASFSSQFETGIFRAYNVARGAEIINGHVIMPGETFDYNSVFPTITAYNGFAYGTVFIDGAPAQGIGGGLCQVSSTLFGAILRLGIVPTQFMPHSNRVHYVPGGLDACMWIQEGHPCNLIFTNPFDVPIYLTASTNNGTLNVEFWSTADVLGDYTFQPTSQMVNSDDRHETWSAWLRTYRNGNFVSERHLVTHTYIR